MHFVYKAEVIVDGYRGRLPFCECCRKGISKDDELMNAGFQSPSIHEENLIIGICLRYLSLIAEGIECRIIC